MAGVGTKTVGGSGRNKTTTKSTTGGKKAVDVASLPSTARRCVSLSFLLRFTEHYDLWHKTTRDVVADVIVPLTKDKACCWSELEPETSLLRKGSKDTHFVPPCSDDAP